jgi:ribosomal-protein-alanine N-acetyltransferase
MTTGTRDRVVTERMVCERLRPDHGPELITLLLDPRVARTLWPRQAAPTEEDVLELLGAKVNHWKRFGFGLWLLRDRSTGTMVGRGGLQHTRIGGAEEVEAGWAIVPERWGQGLATELALASVEMGFEDLDLNRIVAFALPDNIASRRVMEKSGFQFDRDIVHVGLPHVLYQREQAAG